MHASDHVLVYVRVLGGAGGTRAGGFVRVWVEHARGCIRMSMRKEHVQVCICVVGGFCATLW